MNEEYDVVIAGGGPSGLSAALVLGRARKRVLLCDSGPRRNAAAERIHGFVTRDGTPPSEFRHIGREQLRHYPNVSVRDVRVEDVRGDKGAFEVSLEDGVVRARRVIVGVGMVDELPPIPGYRELWGKAIFQCPYCHGWEVQDGAFALIASGPPMVEFSLFLRGWTKDLVVFTDARFEVADDLRRRVLGAGITIEERAIAKLIPDASGQHLEAIELADGARIARRVVFARPAQRQPALVTRLDLALDENGFVRLSEHRETSRPGIYAAGDSTTMMQGALVAASSGAHAAYMLNHELTMELAASGLL
ncbi:MAG: NAD(P)/FAD-dependent oxidoreductase [Polyangiaceae bacterium]|nr:NAD(P)/FAD-dependent oxidoreductase [Polyangiaceae bacterium]